MTDSDNITFLPEHEGETECAALPPWKILIVDDEPGVHAASRLALRDIRFRGRGLVFVDAFSGREALEKLHENEDIAVVFLDVVMETEDAGLRAARQIREDGFHLPRIVLRTGHPGYAPEREVIVNYDIHDYKEKSSLDFAKLFSCLISALRAYDDLVAIEQHRRGLMSVLEAVSWFDFRSLQRYLSRMLAELSSLANIELDDLLLATRPNATTTAKAPFSVLVDGLGAQSLNTAERSFIDDSLNAGQSRSDETRATFFINACGVDLLLFTRDSAALAEADLVLLELFLNKVAQALSNYRTFTEILSERDSLVRSCANQSEEWGGHDSRELEAIQRLSRLTSARLQQKLDFPEEIDDWFVFSIGTASGFHDLGLQSLPHQLFEKSGVLSDEERATLKQHARNGLALLQQKLGSLRDSRLYAMSEKVILQHHERHDGSGYPDGLAGNAVALPARIVGVIDTYVAMTSPRPHRPARSEEETLAHLREGRGTLFDPRVVDAFLEVLAEQH